MTSTSNLRLTIAIVPPHLLDLRGQITDTDLSSLTPMYVMTLAAHAGVQNLLLRPLILPRRRGSGAACSFISDLATGVGEGVRKNIQSTTDLHDCGLLIYETPSPNGWKWTGF